MKKILAGLLLIGVCGLVYGAGGDVERAPAIRKTTGGYTMGNVGIGTTDTSAAALTVAGDVSVSGTVTFDALAATGSGANYFIGNTGVGTSTPSSLLDLQQSGTAKAVTDMFELTNSGNAADMDGTGSGILFNQWYYDASTPAVAESARISAVAETDWTSTASTQDSALRFSTALDGTIAEKMRITSAGNVGIGSITPGAKLDVVGNILADSAVTKSFDNNIEFVTYSGLQKNKTNFAVSNSLITYNGNQYYAFYDSDGYVNIGKRSSGGTWSFTSYSAWGAVTDDAHNGIALGIDSGGYIHIAYNMHVSSLQYRKSSTAEDVTSFSDVLSMLGTNESAVTYPMFFTDEDTLYFTFRDGISGNGDTYLYTYNTNTTTWIETAGTTAGKLIDGKNSNPVCSAYLSRPVVDEGYIHFIWSWRDTGEDFQNNLCFVKLNVAAGTWHQSDGTTQTIPITKANCDTITSVDVTEQMGDGTSTRQLAIDSSNNMYVLWEEDDASNITQSYLIKYATTWGSPIQLTYDKGDYSRDGIIFSIEDRIVCMFANRKDRTGIRVIESFDGFSTTEEYTLFDSGITSNTEIRNVDWDLLDSTGVYSLALQCIDSKGVTYTKNPIYILNWDLNSGCRYIGSSPSGIYEEGDIHLISNNGQLYARAGGLNLLGSAQKQFAYFAAGDVLNILTAPKLLYLWTDLAATTEPDLSSEGNNGTFTGTFQTTYDGMTTTAGYLLGKGLLNTIKFNGTTNYLVVADDDSLSFGDGSNDSAVSIGAFIKASSAADTRMILSKYNSNTSNREYEFMLREASSFPALYLYDNSSGVNCTRLANSALTNDAYYFIVFTYDGSGGATAANGINLYVNGISAASTASNNASYVAMENLASSVFVGANATSGGSTSNHFDDEMGIVFITGEVLTAAQVWKLYVSLRGYYNI